MKAEQGRLLNTVTIFNTCRSLGVSPNTVHEIPVGGEIVHVDASTVHVLNASGAVHMVVTLDPAAKVTTPTTNGVLPEETGWVAYTNYYNNDAPIGSFQTPWSVPNTPPANTGQTLFLFNSIEPASFDGIMQPVIPIFVRLAALTRFLRIAVGRLRSRRRRVLSVSTGQSLHGAIGLVGVNGNSFSYLCQFTNIGGTALEVNGGEELIWSTLTPE
ncbi:hypothetical protein DFH08DRAFT_975522 [Mycena albidolilacea]|uniref:Uncharacterized protein n=1 Tax=Mycena albidolilacea TaxID=1033008 RepID=A0AAD7EAV1_9AGAR|nr:hypothetical protein DFH08DRAFT_975522 [Mycena albidolilacea]